MKAILFIALFICGILICEANDLIENNGPNDDGIQEVSNIEDQIIGKLILLSKHLGVKKELVNIEEENEDNKAKMDGNVENNLIDNEEDYDGEPNERCILGTKGCNIHCLAKGKRYGRCKHGKCHCY